MSDGGAMKRRRVEAALEGEGSQGAIDIEAICNKVTDLFVQGPESGLESLQPFLEHLRIKHPAAVLCSAKAISIFQVDVFWAMHLSGFIDFGGDYMIALAAVEGSCQRVVDFIRDSLLDPITQSQSSIYEVCMLSSIAVDIAIYIFEGAHDTSRVQQTPGDGLPMRFQQSLADICDVSCHHGNAGLIHGRSDGGSSTVHSKDDFSVMLTTSRAISLRANNVQASEAWLEKVVAQWMDSLVEDCTEVRAMLGEFVIMVAPVALIVRSYDTAMRSELPSSLDYDYEGFATPPRDLYTAPFAVMVLETVIRKHNGGRPAMAMAMAGSGPVRDLLACAAKGMCDGVAQRSSWLLLRSVRMADWIFSALEEVDSQGIHMHANIQSSAHRSVHSFREWLGEMLGPVDSFRQIDKENRETPSGEPHPGTTAMDKSDKLGHVHGHTCQEGARPIPIAVTDSQSLEFVALTLCEAVPYLNEKRLQEMVRTLRDRKHLSKDSIDVYMANARSRMTQISKEQNISTTGLHAALEAATAPSLQPERVASWAQTIRETKFLPVAVGHTCSLLGKNGYLGLWKALRNMVTANPTLRNACCEIALAMTTTAPPLCPLEAARDFVSELGGGRQHDAEGECGDSERDVRSLTASLLLPAGSARLQSMQSMVRVCVQAVDLLEKRSFPDKQVATRMRDLYEKAYGEVMHALNLGTDANPSVAEDNFLHVSSILCSTFARMCGALAKWVPWEALGAADSESQALPPPVKDWLSWVASTCCVLCKHRSVNTVLSITIATTATTTIAGEAGSDPSEAALTVQFAVCSAKVQKAAVDQLLKRSDLLNRTHQQNQVKTKGVFSLSGLARELCATLSKSICLLAAAEVQTGTPSSFDAIIPQHVFLFQLYTWFFAHAGCDGSREDGRSLNDKRAAHFRAQIQTLSQTSASISVLAQALASLCLRDILKIDFSVYPGAPGLASEEHQGLLSQLIGYSIRSLQASQAHSSDASARGAMVVAPCATLRDGNPSGGDPQRLEGGGTRGAREVREGVCACIRAAVSSAAACAANEDGGGGGGGGGGAAHGSLDVQADGGAMQQEAFVLEPKSAGRQPTALSTSMKNWITDFLHSVVFALSDRGERLLVLQDWSAHSGRSQRLSVTVSSRADRGAAAGNAKSAPLDHQISTYIGAVARTLLQRFGE